MPETFEASQTENRPAKKVRVSKARLFSKLLFLILLASVLILGYLYFTAKKELQRVSTTQGQSELAQKEVKEVTDKLSKLTILPQEEPVIATILDVKALATQSAFYANAENGDKLVVYPTAQKAYIYSPAKNIIVNAGPLVVNQDQSTRPVRFELRNGSTTPGAAAKLKTKLEEQNQLVSALGDAYRKDYAQTLVIPVNPAIKPDQLADFAKSLTTNAKVSTALPAGEASSEADILIIVGEGVQTTTSSSPTPSESPTP